MPLPLLFIGIAAATGSVGIGKSVKAGIDTVRAKRLNRSANELVQEATDTITAQRTICGRALRELGEEKV